MRLVVRDIYNGYLTKCKDKVTQEWTVEGDTLEECFRKTYPSYRSNRYCYDHRIEFADQVVQKQFSKYCHNVPASEYYGNATVD